MPAWSTTTTASSTSTGTSVPPTTRLTARRPRRLTRTSASTTATSRSASTPTPTAATTATRKTSARTGKTRCPTPAFPAPAGPRPPSTTRATWPASTPTRPAPPTGSSRRTTGSSSTWPRPARPPPWRWASAAAARSWASTRSARAPRPSCTASPGPGSTVSAPSMTRTASAPPPSSATATSRSASTSTATATATPMGSPPPRSSDPAPQLATGRQAWDQPGLAASATSATRRGGLGPGGGRQRAAVPGLDDVPGDRHRRRQRDLARLDGGEQLVPAEPVRLGQLVVVDGDGLARRGVGTEAEHQAARHRPGLAADVPDVLHLDAGFLTDLTDHGLLSRFARVHEPGQDRHPAPRPGGVPGQQAPVIRVGHQHDDRGIGPREVLGAILGADGRMPARGGHRRGAVHRAVGVRVVPVGQRHRVGEQPRVPVPEQRPRLAQRRRPDAIGRGGGQLGVDAEIHQPVAPVGVLTQQHPDSWRRRGGRDEDQL